MPDRYKSIIHGGGKHNNCTKRDTIKLNDKCIYLIIMLNTALNSFPKNSWRNSCEESSKTFRYKSQEGLEMVEQHIDEIPDSKLLTNID